jgi:hypothetical protein
MQRLHLVSIILLFVFSVWGLWLNYERAKLNQRYELLIEQKGKQLEDLIEVTRRLRELDSRLQHSHGGYPIQKQ